MGGVSGLLSNAKGISGASFGLLEAAFGLVETVKASNLGLLEAGGWFSFSLDFTKVMSW